MFRNYTSAILIVVACATLASVVLVAPAVYSATDDGSVAAKSDAKLENAANALTTPSVPEKGTAISDDAANPKAAAEALQRRAGEQVGNDPKGRASLLGMYLQEADRGRVKVVEVGTSTPAFDAGVHEGDEILSYQGFSADSYRKWIDGIRKLTTEAPADSRIPVVVLRDGKRTTLRIRVAEKAVRTPSSRVLAQQANQGQPATGPGAPAPIGASGNPSSSGGNVLNENGGSLGEFSGDQNAGPNERATAEIFRLNVTPPTTPRGARQNSRVGTVAPAGGGMRIGLAGFRDDPAGMVVMVDVGALAPGNYTVSISDPSGVMGGLPGAGPVAPNPNTQRPSQIQSPSQQLAPPVPVPNGTGQQFQPRQGGPAAPPAGAGQRQGRVEPIPRTVLAQVAANGQANTSASTGSNAAAAGQTRPSIAPPTRQVRPLTAPAGGQVNPTTTTPTDLPSVNNSQPAPANQATTGVNRNNTGGLGTDTGVNGAAGAGINEIGTLTVDQSGTGRMQRTVEGVQVRNVVGQAIVIFSQGGTQTTLPANLNGVTGPAGRQQGVIDSSSARGSQAGVGGVQPGATPPAAAVGQATTSPRAPVAAGIIRLMSDRRPPATGNDTTGTPAGVNSPIGQPAGVNPPIEQPASATPTTGQNIVR